MLESAKAVLRIDEPDFDGEITDLINACLKDLALAGIYPPPGEDPLIKRAVLTYVKANFGPDGGGDNLHRQYDAIKLNLRESGDYRALE